MKFVGSLRIAGFESEGVSRGMNTDKNMRDGHSNLYMVDTLKGDSWSVDLSELFSPSSCIPSCVGYICTLKSRKEAS